VALTIQINPLSTIPFIFLRPEILGETRLNFRQDSLEKQHFKVRIVHPGVLQNVFWSAMARHRFVVARHVARFLLEKSTTGWKNRSTARDMSRNSKAASCCRTPKGVFPTIVKLWVALVQPAFENGEGYAFARTMP
jgi:hypothetical protein